MSGAASLISGPVLVSPAPATDLTFVSPGEFEVQFRLVPNDGYGPTADEQAFMVCVNGCVDALAALRLRLDSKDDRSLLEEAHKGRDNGVKRLRIQAEEVVRRPLGPERDREARARLAECWRIEGCFTEHFRRLNTTPFTVEPVKRKDAPDLVEDVRVKTRDVPIPDAVARLKAEIDIAVTVTKVVLGERERAGTLTDWLFGYDGGRAATRLRLNEYMVQLYGIGEVGLKNLDPTQAAFARADLQRYRAEFAMREAGVVKNRYVRRLGLVCLLVATASAASYIVIRQNPDWTVAYAFRNFFLLATGTAVGTWLSFSLRRVVLTFDDLAVLEEDRLDPGLRVLFMVGLVAVVGLLFWTGAVSFGIGPLGSQEAMQRHGAWALLIGLLAGIAERALGTAVSRRAADFAVSVGGGAGPSGGPPQTAAR